MNETLDDTSDADDELVESASEVLQATIGPREAGQRLDSAMASLFPDRSRALIQKHIAEGAVTLDGAPPKRGTRTAVSEGQHIEYRPPAPELIELAAEPIPLSILYEDGDIVVVDKQKGLVVHPALGHPRGTLVNALLHHVRDLQAIGGAIRPGIVHRLDRDTTGVIVVAKNNRAHEGLVAAFKERKVSKRYLAVTLGVPRPQEDVIETFYGRHPRDRKKFSSRVPEGKVAITHYTVIEVYPGAALIEVDLQTGRTHQIRVHLADRGHPLVGDDRYGRRRPVRDPRTRAALAGFDRPALHAHRLSLRHPVTGRRMHFEAPIPDDLSELIEALRAAAEQPV